MFFFKKREPEEKPESGPVETGLEETELMTEDHFDEPAQPEAEEENVSQPDSPGKGADYSSETALLALIQELVVSPAPKKAGLTESEKEKSTAGQAAVDYYSREAQAYYADSPPPPLPDDEHERLRHLILGHEIRALKDIHSRLADPERRTEDLSQIVTEAIRLRVRRDDELIAVLKTTVDNIVRTSVRQNPADLADSLFPVMGPAIRRSIGESIRARLQDFSRTVEKSFSLTGLKWRIEAIRSGMSFSEVVLLKTLEYQVEQVFFIHAESGQLLLSLIHHDAADEAKDSEQVAAMFTVIQQFVNDSFAQGELNTLEFGDRNIFVVRAPQAYLACVVRGQAPPDLRIDMQTALELMVMECAQDIHDFNGDSSPFKRVLHYIEPLLISRFKDENKRLPLRAILLPAALFLILALPLGLTGYKYYQMKHLEEQVYALAGGPGLMPLRVTPHLFSQWEIVSLKDDLAQDITGRLAAAGLSTERFEVVYLPFISQDPEIVAKRVDRVMADKPDGINYEFKAGDKTLFLSGSAPISWVLSIYERLLSVPGLQRVDINGVEDPQNGVYAWLDEKSVLRLKGRASVNWRETIKEKTSAITGITGVDISEVEDDPDTQNLKRLLENINSTVILFPLNKDQPVPEDLSKLTAAVNDLTIVERLADSMGLSVSLTVYGHADPSGSQKHNYELSQSRAQTLAAMLYARGSSIPISIYGMGADFAAEAGTDQDKEAAAQLSRKIELKAHINRKGGSLALE